MNFMKLAEDIAKTSTCVRQNVGCVIVKDNKVLVSAVNGEVSGDKSCDDLGGCIRKIKKIKSGTDVGLCYAVCAETRCVCEAARDGISIKGATAYCTHKPCLLCTKNFAVAGVNTVYYKVGYPDQNSDTVAKAAGLKVVEYV